MLRNWYEEVRIREQAVEIRETPVSRQEKEYCWMEVFRYVVKRTGAKSSYRNMICNCKTRWSDDTK